MVQEGARSHAQTGLGDLRVNDGAYSIEVYEGAISTGERNEFGELLFWFQIS